MKKHNRKQRPLSPFIPHPHPCAEPRSIRSRSKYDPAKEDGIHDAIPIWDEDLILRIVLERLRT